MAARRHLAFKVHTSTYTNIAGPQRDSSLSFVTTNGSHLFCWSLLFCSATNGVVIATEKKVPSILVDEDSFQKIVNLTDHIGKAWTPASASSSQE